MFPLDIECYDIMHLSSNNGNSGLSKGPCTTGEYTEFDLDSNQMFSMCEFDLDYTVDSDNNQKQGNAKIYM